MNKGKELISIITPSYNSKWLWETFASVLNQTYHEWEWLITDDGSDSVFISTLREIESLDSRVKVFYLDENKGAGFARNYSIEKAAGRFIAFLDSDDLWLPKKLEKQVAFMKEYDLALSYTGYQKFGNSGDYGVVIPPLKTSYQELLKGNVIGCLTAIYDVSKLGKCYMPLIRKRQDYGLWLSILKKTDKVAGLQDVMAKYRVDNGMSSNKFKIALWQWKFYREELELSIFTTFKCFIPYAFKGLIKYFK